MFHNLSPTSPGKTWPTAAKKLYPTAEYYKSTQVTHAICAQVGTCVSAWIREQEHGCRLSLGSKTRCDVRNHEVRRQGCNTNIHIWMHASSIKPPVYIHISYNNHKDINNPRGIISKNLAHASQTQNKCDYTIQVSVCVRICVFVCVLYFTLRSV